MRHLHTTARGTILIIVVICVMIIAGMSAAIINGASAQARGIEVDNRNLAALELAESAIAQARSTMAAATGANGDGIALAVSQAGRTADAVTWNATTNSWQTAGSLPSWTLSSSDLGIGGSTGSPYGWGRGDGFPTAPDTVRNLPGEIGYYAYRLGGGTDERLWSAYARWWGSDGIDNNADGVIDTDQFETRTYTIRAAGIYGRSVIELETVLTRDPPPPPVDPNNPPAGFLSAISIQVPAGSGAPAGSVNIKNNSAANSIDGRDNATSIVGAQAASSSNDTTGVQLAASGASLSLTSNNDSGVGGTGGNPSFNNNGTFIGDIIDTIADGAKSVAKDSFGNTSDNGNAQGWGTASSLAIVYHDFDKYGTLKVGESAAVVGGTTYNNARNGFGILVIDATTISTDPAVAFAGALSKWEGIVIVRVKNNLAPNGPNGAVKATGAGSTAGQIGSVIIYGKQNANFSGGDIYKNNGNRPTQFSLGAVKSALQAFNNQVPPTTVGNVGTPLLWRPIRQPGMAWAME